MKIQNNRSILTGYVSETCTDLLHQSWSKSTKCLNHLEPMDHLAWLGKQWSNPVLVPHVNGGRAKNLTRAKDLQESKKPIKCLWLTWFKAVVSLSCRTCSCSCVKHCLYIMEFIYRLFLSIWKNMDQLDQVWSVIYAPVWRAVLKKRKRPVEVTNVYINTFDWHVERVHLGNNLMYTPCV